MENHRLVLPEHLNHFGFLFGGYLLKWVDEFAWMAATTEFPGCHFVTVGMNEVSFRNSVRDTAARKIAMNSDLFAMVDEVFDVLIDAVAVRNGLLGPFA